MPNTANMPLEYPADVDIGLTLGFASAKKAHRHGVVD